MLSKRNRLNKEEIDNLFASGKNISLGLLRAKAQKREKGELRACILFPKGNKLSAVMKNKLRRQAYGAIQKRKKEFTGAFDIGIMLTGTWIALTQKERNSELEKAITHLQKILQ